MILRKETGYKKEQRVNINTVDITNQAARGMRNNLVFTGVKESDEGKCSQTRKTPKNGIKIYPQFPESNRENRKRVFDLHKKYEGENVETKVVGEKLVFKQSGNQYRKKISLPKTNMVLTSKTETNYKVYHSDLITDGENKFKAHAVEVSSIKEAREASLQILKEPEIAKANHNVLACVYLKEMVN
ncbi:hypothetical protein KUTeg_022181 [Tegillarca granosa]|uniref:Uncharacterized protein n=1 Tax=Tegillarca granosa TaxID=220873 RepID=A0ABQ9E9V3_TEGGR|nr:hypothetical protein KUTeg_022181 [Tegillarca granosa]